MLLRTILEALEKRNEKRRQKRNRKCRGSSSSNGSSEQQRKNDCSSSSSSSMCNDRTSMPLAFALARSWAWPALKYRCETHPQEVCLNSVDSMGETILHWALLGKPPYETVQAILTVSPEMARIRNGAGHLPIHVAIGYRASVDVIRALLEIFPESAGLSNGSGDTPLDLLCDYGGSADSIRAVLEIPQGAATIYRQNRSLEILSTQSNLNQFQRALSSMREARKRQETIRQEINLQKQQQQQQQQQQNDTLTQNSSQPLLDHAELVAQTIILSDAGESSDGEGTSNTSNDTETHADDTRDPNQLAQMLQRHERMIASFQQNDYWQKAAMLVLAEYTKQPLTPLGLHDDQANIVHACAGIHNCPAVLLEFAMLLHHDDLIQRKDARGRLPLHVAAANYAAALLELSFDKASNLRRATTAAALYKILEACPEAAFVPDADDNLPLALAIQELRHSTTGKQAWSSVLQVLLEANLGALETLDMDEKLYPYVWANRMTSVNELFLSVRRNPHLFRSKKNPCSC